MNTRQDWMVNMLGGVVPEQQQQSLSATGQQFAARFEQLLWPLEELVAEWKGSESADDLYCGVQGSALTLALPTAAQASPEVARTTLSLLSNNSYITETRLAVIQDVLLPAMPATEVRMSSRTRVSRAARADFGLSRSRTSPCRQRTRLSSIPRLKQCKILSSRPAPPRPLRFPAPRSSSSHGSTSPPSTLPPLRSSPPSSQRRKSSRVRATSTCSSAYHSTHPPRGWGTCPAIGRLRLRASPHSPTSRPLPPSSRPHPLLPHSHSHPTPDPSPTSPRTTRPPTFSSGLPPRPRSGPRSRLACNCTRSPCSRRRSTRRRGGC